MTRNLVGQTDGCFLLGRIDAVAGIGNRSRFLVDAAEQRLSQS